MALVPNYWTDTVIDVPFDEANQSEWTERLRTVSIRSGFYRAPNQGPAKGRSASGDDSILIDKRTSVTNQYGWELRRDEEDWTYEVVNGPPMAYNRTTYSNCYLPGIGIGHAVRKVEEEKTDYFTFTPLTDGDNLGRIRRISAYVIYTRPIDPTKSASAESKAKAQERGMTDGQLEDRVVSTGKLWSEATRDGTVVPELDAAQTTKWVDGVIEEHDIVEEQIDRWIVWTVVKNALRPGHVEIRGPRDVKKEAFVYKFPFPIEPPTIKGFPSNDGIKIEVSDGGARWTTPYFRQEISIPPDKYNIYRKKVSEPARDAEDDLYDWWETAPTAEGTRSIITNTAVKDFAGAAADPVPTPTSYTEPHDVDPPDEGTETVFELIATVDNENVERRWDKGYAEHLDADVVATADYEYYATAIIADSESPDSEHVTVTAPASRNQRLTIRTFDDGRGADAVAPDDPNLPDDDFGEVEEFEVPTEDIDDVIDDIVERQFAANEPGFQIDLEVLMPLLGLEYGQTIETPTIQWEAFGNQLELETETDGEEWMLVGFNMRFARTKDGRWSSPRTRLTLQERTDK